MRNWIVTLLLLVATTALFSVPAVYYFDSVAVGEVNGPAFANLWRMWAAPTALSGDRTLDLPSRQLFSMKANKQHVIPSVLLPLVLTPVTRLFGPTAAVNLILLLTLFFNGLCAYLFLRAVVGDHGPALAAGMAFAFSTYVLSRVAAGELEMAGVFVLPLGAWAIVRLCDRPSNKTEWTAFAALLFAFLWHVSFGWALLIFALAAAIWTRWVDKQREATHTFLRVIGALALVGFFNFILMMERYTFRESAAGLDVLELVFLPRTYADTVPYFLLIVAAYALVRRPKDAAFWWASALVLFAFSWGERLTVWGRATTIPGPFALLPAGDPLPFAAMAQLCLAVPAAQTIRAAAEYIEKLRPNDEGKLISICVLLGLAVSFFHLPNPAFKTSVPDAYGALFEIEDGAVLELPFSCTTSVNARYRYYQTVHRHRVVSGNPEPGVPHGLRGEVLQVAPSLTPLNGEPINWVGLADVVPAELKTQLRELGVAAVALHPLDVPSGQRDLLETWCEQVFGAPQRRDESTIIFRVGK
ncbi:MAG TPA: hypothetical protein PKW95_07650 [bacterium]|nr:hypothetical protein [bacterium]